MHTTIYIFEIQNIQNVYDGIHIQNTEHPKCVRRYTYSEYRTSKIHATVYTLVIQNIQNVYDGIHIRNTEHPKFMRQYTH